jgi:hypothetical protein
LDGFGHLFRLVDFLLAPGGGFDGGLTVLPPRGPGCPGGGLEGGLTFLLPRGPDGPGGPSGPGGGPGGGLEGGLTFLLPRGPGGPGGPPSMLFEATTSGGGSAGCFCFGTGWIFLDLVFGSSLDEERGLSLRRRSACSSSNATISRCRALFLNRINSARTL